MAPRNQTKKPKSLEERAMLADIKEATKAIKKQRKEDKQQAAIENRIAKHQARLDVLADNAGKAGPVNEPKPEPVIEPKPDPQPNSAPNPDFIVIDD
jgi:hypothetical protein